MNAFQQKNLHLLWVVLTLLFSSCLHDSSHQPKTPMTTYYTFEIDGQHVGYYSETRQPGELYSVAFMQMGGEWYDNSFWLRFDGDRITEYKFTGEDWFTFEEEPDVFPTSALPLLIPRILDEREVTYRQFIEGQHAVGQTAVLKLEKPDLIEEQIGQPHRSVKLKGREVQEYHWGGTAKSIRCTSEEDAKRGLGLPSSLNGL